MTKQKTSIAIEKELWTDWIQFVVGKTGSARKLSDEIEKALKYYMAHGPKKLSHTAKSVRDLESA